MAFTQIYLSKIGTCKRSKRILNENEQIFNSVTNNISKIIKKFTTSKDIKEKIVCFIDIYQVVNNNFNILVQYQQTLNFLYSVYQKKETIISDLKNEIEKGIKIKLLFNKFIKVSSIFEKKYFDHMFKFIKNKSKSEINDDCPICLENIEKKEIVVTECNHCFHQKCLLKSLIERKTCPICRLSLDIQLIYNK
jgi:hypothetical protein